MTTWLQKIARAGAMAATNQFLGSNSMSTPKAGPGAAPRLPSAAGAQPRVQLPTGPTGPVGAGELSQNTGATLAQETLTHGDHQTRVNTAPIQPGMLHPQHPNLA